MAARREHSLSAFIPSAYVVRDRLAEMEAEIEKLKILLKVAEEIEAVDQRSENDVRRLKNRPAATAK